MKRELTCIGCPLGCVLTVEIDNSGDIQVTGYTCARGKDYAIKEVTCPTRIVTSTVPVDGGMISRVSVKTEHDIPKDKIFDVMDEIRRTAVNAPVRIGDTVIEDCAGTGISVIATKNVESV